MQSFSHCKCNKAQAQALACTDLLLSPGISMQAKISFCAQFFILYPLFLQDDFKIVQSLRPIKTWICSQQKVLYITWEWGRERQEEKYQFKAASFKNPKKNRELQNHGWCNVGSPSIWPRNSSRTNFKNHLLKDSNINIEKFLRVGPLRKAGRESEVSHICLSSI